MTGYDVYSEEGGQKSTNTLGIGFVGGLCTTFFVALGEDSAGRFSGMHTLTHEAAHVLGAAHDQSSPKSWITGDPGSLSCSWSEGHIMSYVDGGTRHHRFSECSLKQIRNLVILRGESCWEMSKSRQGHREEGIYPGMQVAPDEFCRSVFPDEKNVSADMNSDRMSECMVKCQYPVVKQYCFGYGRCSTYTAIKYTYQHALDFMYCARDKVCVRGVCGGSAVNITRRPVTTTTTESTAPSDGDTTECRCDCSTTTAASTAYPARPSTPRWTWRTSRWPNGWRGIRRTGRQ